jgi:hypothetical protein
MKAIELDDAATAELVEAIAHYEAVREGLGKEFDTAFESATERMAHLRQSFPIYCDPVRKCVMRRFPSNIFFFEKEDVVFVVAVAHQKRAPGYRQDRFTDTD